MNMTALVEAILSDTPLDLGRIDFSVKTFDEGCYCLYCTKSDKYYIGSSMTMGQRKSTHLSALSSGKHSNTALRKDFEKYGRDSFVFFVLAKCPPMYLEQLEQGVVKMVGFSKLYNKEAAVVRSKKWPGETWHLKGGPPPKPGTVEYLRTSLGISKDTFRKRWARRIGTPYDGAAQVSINEIKILRAKYIKNR